MIWQLQTPVSVFFYRRPGHLRQVMAKVREVRPPALFGISDGPKPGNPEIQMGVEESRKVFREAIDWPCRWELLERETNLGSYLSVSRGLDWVFERVSETIVLEDDTVPDPTFFRFVAELLEKYRREEGVGAVCGNNYDDHTDWPKVASYRFTRYHHSWGWGTWRRAWRIFDREEKLLAELPQIRKENWPKLARGEWAYWERCFRRSYAKKLDAWDYRWTLSLWRHRMVCVIPRVNLVRNIGFDEKATHTVERDFLSLEMHRSKALDFPLKPAETTGYDVRLDDRVFSRHYRVLEGRRNLLKKLVDRIKKKKIQKNKKSHIKITLYDRVAGFIRKTWLPSLHADPASFKHDISSCSRRFPKTFTYQYVEKKTNKTYDTLLLTDSNIMSWKDYKAKKLFGWISESSVIVPEVIDDLSNKIEIYQNAFVKIFTCDENLLKRSNLFEYSLAAANLPWVRPIASNIRKSRLLSIIASAKNLTYGHNLRDDAIKKFPDIDVYGRGRKEIRKKEDGLYPYFFSIVIENGNYPSYFTEKITDCFASKTVPIYWGSDSIKKYFNPKGILKYSDTEPEILSVELYEQMLIYIEENYQKVQLMESADDMIFRKIKRYLL